MSFLLRSKVKILIYILIINFGEQQEQKKREKIKTINKFAFR